VSKRKLSPAAKLRAERRRERAVADLVKWPIHLRAGKQFVDHLTACDLFLHDEIVWAPEQLVWLPLKSQCRDCHAHLVRGHPGHGAPDVDYTTCDTHSATPLMLTIVELAMHAWGGFCAATDATGSHSDRGCYFEFEPGGDRYACWCGRTSLLDVCRVHGTLDWFGLEFCEWRRLGRRPTPDSIGDRVTAGPDRYRGGKPIGYPVSWNGVDE
jgi:hypothetical protein